MKNLIVEITSRCNLSCPMCLRHSWKDAEGDMDVEVFRSLLSSRPNLDSLNLTGYGEPFVHPRLVEMIRTARDLLPGHTRIHLVSNGTLMERGVVRDVIHAGLSGIALSMDSLEDDTFQSVRGGASLRSVADCLDSLVAVRESAPRDSFAIDLSIVAMERNIQELPHLVRFAADHRVDAIWVNNVLPYTEPLAGEILYDSHSENVLKLFGRTSKRLREAGVEQGALRGLISRLFSLKAGSDGSASDPSRPPEERLVLQLAREMASVDISMGGICDTMLRIIGRDEARFTRHRKTFQEARETAARQGLELHLPLLTPRTDRECNFIKNEMCFVTWDGYVRPCNQLAHDYSCFHYGRPKTVKSVSFGRIPEEDLGVIWNSQGYREFRKTVTEFPFSPCGDCGLSDGCGYIAPDRDFLCDCNMCEQPCGDCLWSRGILQCP
jgi:putative metalloenzyme radical SAM/SPASM domain maturase